MIDTPETTDHLAWQRAELLQRAWDLDSRHQPRALAELLGTRTEAELLIEPELGFLLARSWRNIGDRDRALALARKLEAPLSQLGNPRLARRRTFFEGVLHLEFGDLEHSRELFMSVLDASIRSHDTFNEAAALSALGSIASLQCRFPEALALYQRTLVLDVNMTRHGVALHWNNIGGTYREMGFPEEADANFQKSMEISAECGDRELYVFSGVLRAQLMGQRGDTKLATESATRFYEIVDREALTVDPFRDADMLQLQAEIARRDGRLADARALLDRARVTASKPGVAWILADVWSEQMHLELAEGNADAAIAAANEAARIFGAMGADKRASMVIAQLAGAT